MDSNDLAGLLTNELIAKLLAIIHVLVDKITKTARPPLSTGPNSRYRKIRGIPL